MSPALTRIRVGPLAIGALAGIAIAGAAAAVARSAGGAGADGSRAAARQSRSPIDAAGNWRHYVEANGSHALRPVGASVVGAVSNPGALLHGHGVTTLTWTAGQPQPIIVLDYGKEVGGLPYFDVSSVTPAGSADSVMLKAGYSEAREFLLALAGNSQSVVGDGNGNNGVGTDPNRTDTFTLTAVSDGKTVANPVTEVQGGERFEAVTLASPGSVSLSGAGIRPRFNNVGANAYQGYFLSSDDTLNSIWYDGVYTAQVDSVPTGDVCSRTSGAGAPSCSREPTILDGAKRDRQPWSGDLSVEARTLFDSLGFGANGSAYVEGALREFGSAPQTNGSICGEVSNWISSPATCEYYSPAYSMYFPIDLAEYYLYSGDQRFAESEYQTMKHELAFNASSIDPSTGLSDAAGRDWDYYDGSKGGSASQGSAVAATNMLDYEALADGSWLADELAAMDPGNPKLASWRSDAASWARQAAALKRAINARLFNGSLGAYQLSSTANGAVPADAVPQDANAEAIDFGIAPAREVPGMLGYLKRALWGAHGPQPFSANAGYSTVISPFVTGYELDARFISGDTRGAMALTKLMWAQMVNRQGPFYTGTFWEKLGENGQITDSNTSLAHGWATAPVSAFSSYILGVRPIDPGYSSWSIAPQAGDLSWAQGRVPTPHGSIVCRWQSRQAAFKLTIAAPAGTTGTVTVPLEGHLGTVAEDGRIVWSDDHPARGVGARRGSGDVVFTHVHGAHTFASD